MIEMLIAGGMQLAGLIGDAIAKETGVDAKVTKKIALATAKAWAAQTRADITAARERAKKRVKQ